MYICIWSRSRSTTSFLHLREFFVSRVFVLEFDVDESPQVEIEASPDREEVQEGSGCVVRRGSC